MSQETTSVRVLVVYFLDFRVHDELDQNPSDLPPDEDELLPSDDEEETFRLEDVSSDVEVDEAELDDDSQ